MKERVEELVWMQVRVKGLGSSQVYHSFTMDDQETPRPMTVVEKMLFIESNRLYFASYSKCLSPDDIKQIFEHLSEEITEGVEERLSIAIERLECMLGCVKEERYWLHFGALGSLVELLGTTTCLRTVALITRIIFTFLKMKQKLLSIALLKIGNDLKTKMLVFVFCWFLGTNLGRSNDWLSMDDKVMGRELEASSQVELTEGHLFNSQVIDMNFLEEIVLHPFTHSKTLVDLSDFRGDSLTDLLAFIQVHSGLLIDKGSLNGVILQVRLVMHQALCLNDCHEKRREVLQMIGLISLTSSCALKSISKVSPTSRSLEKLYTLFSPMALKTSDQLSLDNILEVFPRNFISEETFRYTLVFTFNSYIYKNDQSTEVSDQLKLFLHGLLERALAVFCDTATSSDHFGFTLSDLTVAEIVRMVNLLYTSESKHRPNEGLDYTDLLDLLLSLKCHYSQLVSKSFEPDCLHVLLEINRVMLNELGQDKDLVIFNVFLEDLVSLLRLYPSYDLRLLVPGVYDNYQLLLFEKIEALDSYFIDPLKSEFSFHLPRLARQILESEVFDSGVTLDLMRDSDGFLFVFNELMVLLNDLLNEVQESALESFLQKFRGTGLLRAVFDRFGKSVIVNEFDSLGFFVNLTSKVHLHLRSFFDEDPSSVLHFVMSQLLRKDALLSNLRRFSSNDSSIALKNFTDEVLELVNVNSTLLDSTVVALINLLSEARKVMQESTKVFQAIGSDPQTLHSTVTSQIPTLHRYGFFSDLSMLSQRLVIEELQLISKTVNNFTRFVIKFFDNYKTNIYQNVLERYEGVTDRPLDDFFDFFFIDCCVFLPFQLIHKQKKQTLALFRYCVMTNNSVSLVKIRDYIFVKVFEWETELRTLQGQLTPADFGLLAKVLLDKGKTQKGVPYIVTLDLRSDLLRFVKCYVAIGVAFDFLKSYMSLSNDLTSLKDLFTNTASLVSLFISLDAQLLLHSESLINSQIRDELLVQQHETYLSFDEKAPFSILQGFFKGLKFTREHLNTEILMEIFTKVLKFKMLEGLSYDTLPLFTIDVFVKSIKDLRRDCPSLRPYHLYLMSTFTGLLVEFLNLYKLLYENYSLSGDYHTEYIYHLCHLGFYDVVLPTLMTDLSTLVTKNSKAFKHLINHRFNHTVIGLRDAMLVYYIDELLSKNFKNICFFYDSIFSIKKISIPINVSETEVVQESFVCHFINVTRLKSLASFIVFLKSHSKHAFTLIYLNDRNNLGYESFEGLQLQSPLVVEFKHFELDYNPFDQEDVGGLPFLVLKNSILLTGAIEMENFYMSLIRYLYSNGQLIEVEGEGRSVPFFELLSGDSSTELRDSELAVFRCPTDVLELESLRRYTYTHPLPLDVPLDYYNQSTFREIQSIDLTKSLESSRANLELMFYHFFNNYIKLLNGRLIVIEILRNQFKNQESSIRLATCIDLCQQVVLGILMGKPKSKSKGELRLLVSEKESLDKILALMVDLVSLNSSLKEVNLKTLLQHSTKVAMEDQSKSPFKTLSSKRLEDSPAVNDTIKYLMQLIEGLLLKKLPIKKLQACVTAVLEICLSMEKSLEEKLEVIRMIGLMLRSNKGSKERETSAFVNEEILKLIIQNLIVSFEEDDQLLERLMQSGDLRVFKELLKVGGVYKSNKHNGIILQNIRLLFEIVFGQKACHVILLESELKSFLKSRQGKGPVMLADVVRTFEAMTKGKEKTFAGILSRVCIFEKDDQGQTTVSLATTERYTVKCIAPTALVEVLGILFRDACSKFRKTRRAETSYFDRMLVCEMICCQVLPRYSFLYKTCERQLMLLFEEILKSHFNYLFAFYPLLFDYPVMVESEETKEPVSVAREVRLKLFAKVESLLKEVLLSVQGPSDDSGAKVARNFKRSFVHLTNIGVFLVQASKSLLVMKELESGPMLVTIIQLMEECYMTLSKVKGVDQNLMTSLLAVPDVLRRQHILLALNDLKGPMSSDRSRDSNSMVVPNTFKFQLESMQLSKVSKFAVKDFAVSSTTVVNFSIFGRSRFSKDYSLKIKDNFIGQGFVNGVQILRHGNLVNPILEAEEDEEEETEEDWEDEESEVDEEVPVEDDGHEGEGEVPEPVHEDDDGDHDEDASDSPSVEDEEEDEGVEGSGRLTDEMEVEGESTENSYTTDRSASSNSERDNLDSDTGEEPDDYNDQEIMREIANELGEEVEIHEGDDEDEEDDEDSDIDDEFDDYSEEYYSEESIPSEALQQEMERKGKSTRIETLSRIYEHYPFRGPVNIAKTRYSFLQDPLVENYLNKLQNRIFVNLLPKQKVKAFELELSQHVFEFLTPIVNKVDAPVLVKRNRRNSSVINDEYYENLFRNFVTSNVIGPAAHGGVVTGQQVVELQDSIGQELRMPFNFRVQNVEIGNREGEVDRTAGGVQVTAAHPESNLAREIQRTITIVENVKVQPSIVAQDTEVLAEIPTTPHEDTPPEEPLPSESSIVNEEPSQISEVSLDVTPIPDTGNQVEDQPVSFDMSVIGLPSNFLEIAGMDLTFFEALPRELQIETALAMAADLNIQPYSHGERTPIGVDHDQRSRQSSMHQEIQDHQNDNYMFVLSLSPEMREEVLVSCPDDFLMSLPEDVQAEARNLRDNVFTNNWRHNDDHEREPEPDNGNINSAPSCIKKFIKKNKQRTEFEKVFEEGVSRVADNEQGMITHLLRLVSGHELHLRNLSVSYLSSLLFDPECNDLFFNSVFRTMEESSDMQLKERVMRVLESLSYSNYFFFYKPSNMSRYLEFFKRNIGNEKLVGSFLKILNHVLKSSLSLENKSETCLIVIDNQNLSDLTLTLYLTKFDFTESLSMILYMLSLNSDNLKLIINNLKESIDKFAFNLNVKLVEILEERERIGEGGTVTESLSKKIIAIYSLEVRLHKIFKLLEQLFKRSFVKTEESEGHDKSEELAFDVSNVKSKVLESFSNYFNQKNIKRIFLNLFKVLRFFENRIDDRDRLKKFSKPIFVKFVPLVESFFIIYKLLCDQDYLNAINPVKTSEPVVGSANKMKTISSYQDDIDSQSIMETISIYTNMSEMEVEEITEERPAKKNASESSIRDIYKAVINSNQKLLNYFMNSTPKLSNSPLNIIIRLSPGIVNFDLKRKYFQQYLSQLRSSYTLRLEVQRENVFQDSYMQLLSKSSTQMRGKLHVKFVGEEGEDAGGVQRGWYLNLSHEIFNPNYALFIPASHGYAYQPSVLSGVNIDHLNYFRFVGKIVGKALFDSSLLDVHFTRSFYKHMTGANLHYSDFEDYDPDYYRTLKWIVENDVNDLDMDFTSQQEIFGKSKLIELKPNGKNLTVDNDNKQEYIRLITELKMTEEIKDQIRAFLDGLHCVVPAEILRIFDPKELELLISGLPEIDLQNLQENTDYVNYSKDSPTIRYFWEVLNSFDEQTRAGFLQFVTGTSKVPLEGFGSLKGIGGNVQKFNIHKAYDTLKLPTTHTCMNQLDLPEYITKKELEEKLRKAIMYGKEGFGFV